MTRVWLVTLFGAAAGLSCGETTVLPQSQLNLDRPVDIAFACYGLVSLNGQLTPTAQPATWCNSLSPQLTAEAYPAPAGQDPKNGLPTWYGFILQSASGTVALAQWEAKPSDQFSGGSSLTGVGDVVVRDADPRTPGKNSISVGEDPIAIVTDSSGCFEVTANAGSCDLSALDINSVLTTDVTTTVNVTRKVVTNSAGKAIRAKPSAMVVEPNIDASAGIQACTAAPTGLAYVAYPGCHLVAAVDLGSGQITAGLRYDALDPLAAPTVLSAAQLSTLECVDECNGAAPTAGVRPVTLSLQVDARAQTRRLAIGAERTSAITVVDLDTTFKPAATVPLQVKLEDPTATLGVTTVALSPQVAMGNSAALPRHNNNNTGEALGTSPGGEGQYVYAVATDGTVRVADVLGVKAECDTQIDMQLVRPFASVATNIPRLECFPVGDPTNPPRRTGARGPGIELPVDGVPTSVTIIKGLDQPLTTSVTTPVVNPDGTPVLNPDGTPKTETKDVENAPTPAMLIGYFAVISASSGQVFVANIDDDDGPDVFVPAGNDANGHALVLSTAPVLVIAHQLRDGFGQRGAPPPLCSSIDPLNGITGGPRSSSKPGAVIPVTTLPATKAGVLPEVLQEACTGPDPTDATKMKTETVSELQLGASLATRDRVYPDLRSVRSETWTMTWEGTLSNDGLFAAVDGPPIRNGQMIVDKFGMRLVDQTRPFCDMGVEPFDIVQFRGCNPSNGNLDCPSGYSCFVSDNNQVANLGSCMLESEASRLAVACGDFLTTARRYTVGHADSGEIVLLPRKRVLATTPVDGCVSDAQCTTLADYALVLRSGDQPGVLRQPAPPHDDLHTWACRTDELRKPIAGTNQRCIETCNATEQCDLGTVCIGGTAGAPDGAVRTGTCMESVLPPQSCVNGPQRFEVHAGEAFTVIGARSGYVHPIVERGAPPADGNTTASKNECIVDPNASRLQVGRIPLQAPACGPDPTAGPNPCSLTVTHADDQPNYQPGTCTADDAAPTVLVSRQAPAIQLSNPALTLTMVDPYSPGDLTCNQDRQAGLGNIPLLLQAPFDVAAAAGYQLTFELRGGYTALPVGGGSLLPVFPVKVIRGPSDSIWVMDNGDFLATQARPYSTRGEVFRVESTSLGKVNELL